jgi:hypothetical protein
VVKRIGFPIFRYWFSMKDDSQQIFESIMEEVSKIESALTNPPLTKVPGSDHAAGTLDESIKGLQKIADLIVQNTGMKDNKSGHSV